MKVPDELVLGHCNGQRQSRAPGTLRRFPMEGDGSIVTPEAVRGDEGANGRHEAQRVVAGKSVEVDDRIHGVFCSS